MIPTASPSPVPTTAAANYMPFNSQAGYEGGDPNTIYAQTDAGFVQKNDTEAHLDFSIPTSPPSCAGAVPGNISDYTVNSAQLVVANQTYNQAQARLNGQFGTYVLTKDAQGNIFIDGYYTTSSKICVTPYLLMKLPAVAGDSWTYTDINGSVQVANVVSVGQTMTFQVTGTGPNGGRTVGPFSNVATVTYGNTLTLYWALGVGPVASSNTVSAPNGPMRWTMFQIKTVPNSP